LMQCPFSSYGSRASASQDLLDTMTRYLITIMTAATLAGGCAKEPPPISVNEFLDKPFLLDAAMVRCSQDRLATRYEVECVNAREAVARIAVKEDAVRKAEMDARSDAKRRALRRTQSAAAAARRQAAEAVRRREEAEYLAQFGVVPGPDGAGTGSNDAGSTANSPLAVIAEPTNPNQSSIDYGQAEPATDGGNAPIATTAPVEDDGSSLDAIREELQRRNKAGVD
jgi:hypothetical protein